MKVNFKGLYGYARSHPGLTFVVAHTMHTRGNPKLGPAHNACGYNSTKLANFFGSCDIWGVPNNPVVFEDHFDRVLYQHSMKPARGHLLYDLPRQAWHWPKSFYDLIKIIKIFYSSSSRIAGTHMAYNSSRVKSISLKWLYFRSAFPSSSNWLNAWILCGLSISAITSWSGKCQSNRLSLTYLLRRCILPYSMAGHETYQWKVLYVSLQLW